MSFKVEIYKSGDWRDISGYVTDVGSISYITTNRDFTLNAEGTDMQFSNAYTDYTFDRDDQVLIWSGSILLFNGFIEAINQNYKTRQFDVDVRHALENFNSTKVDEDDLKTEIDARDTTKNIYTNDYTVIFVFNTISAIFASNGFSIDSTYYNGSKNLGTMKSRDEDANLIYEPNCSANNMYFLPNQIYCINQDGVFTPNEIAGSTSRINKKITQFELLSEISSVIGLSFIPSSSDTFYIVNDTTAYTIGDEHTYDLKVDEKQPTAQGLKLSQTTLLQWPSTLFFPESTGFQFRYYQDGHNDEWNVGFNFISGSGQTTLSYLNHFQPMLLISSASTHYCRPFIPDVDSYSSIAGNKMRAKAKAYTLTKTETDIVITPKTVLSNEIDIEKQISTIQEATF